MSCSGARLFILQHERSVAEAFIFRASKSRQARIWTPSRKHWPKSISLECHHQKTHKRKLWTPKGWSTIQVDRPQSFGAKTKLLYNLALRKGLEWSWDRFFTRLSRSGSKVWASLFFAETTNLKTPRDWPFRSRCVRTSETMSAHLHLDQEYYLSSLMVLLI